MENKLLWGIAVMFGLMILYRIFFMQHLFNKDYQKRYKDILNSDEYKVKGQYDK